MTMNPNAVGRHAPAHRAERFGHNGCAARYGGAPKRHKSKRWAFVIAFLLAAVCTAVPCARLLDTYGASWQPALENVYRVIVGGAEQPPGGEPSAGHSVVPFAGEVPGEAPLAGRPPAEAPFTDGAVAGSLGVSLIYQNPELKNGCEATSLAMLLRYRGYSVDKSILAYEYVPREDFVAVDGIRYGPHPGTAYPGDPATTKGFYCYPGPIVTGANRFLDEQGESLRAYDISGAGKEELARELQEGHPVMVWITMDYGAQPAYLDFTWQLPDGRTYTPYGNLHCVVLSGAGNSDYQVCDPINGPLAIGQEMLWESYQAMGSMAVVIK